MAQINRPSVDQLYVDELEGSYRRAEPAEVLEAALGFVESQV